jgi:hypothetical protein
MSPIVSLNASMMGLYRTSASFGAPVKSISVKEQDDLDQFAQRLDTVEQRRKFLSNDLKPLAHALALVHVTKFNSRDLLITTNILSYQHTLLRLTHWILY